MVLWLPNGITPLGQSCGQNVLYTIINIKFYIVLIPQNKDAKWQFGDYHYHLKWPVQGLQEPHLLTKINWTRIGVTTWTSNYIHVKQWDALTHPCHNFKCTWWRHQMETISASLAIGAGNSPVTGEFPAQRPVTRSFDVFFDLRLNTRLSKQWWGWWFETPSGPLWRHRNELS